MQKSAFPACASPCCALVDCSFSAGMAMLRHAMFPIFGFGGEAEFSGEGKTLSSMIQLNELFTPYCFSFRRSQSFVHTLLYVLNTHVHFAVSFTRRVSSAVLRLGIARLRGVCTSRWCWYGGCLGGRRFLIRDSCHFMPSSRKLNTHPSRSVSVAL